ncbi:MAG: hypothetical protein RL480_671 [Pseudomonadota bacterium]|jgi:hypothetical protein
MVKNLFVAVLLALAAALPALPAAAFWLGTKGDQPAVSGYDVVSYFAGTPAAGSAEFTVAHDGAIFRFANAANRDIFIKSPDRYAPQFGGHCAWAASQGRLAGPDPTIWHIVGDKLYLNCSKDADTKWLADVPGNIAKGEAFWEAHEYGAEP